MNRRYCNGMVHVIKQGETLYQLSRRYRVPLALILRANPYVDVYNLQVGQEICIPVVRHYNGMVCMPVQRMDQQMGTEQDRMSDRMQDEMRDEMQNEMRDRMQERQMEEEMTPQEMREMDRETEREMGSGQPQMQESVSGSECSVCEQEELEKNDEKEDDVEIYITSGDRSLGDILNEHGVNWEEFVKNNNLSQILLGEDVVLYLPKKSTR